MSTHKYIEIKVETLMQFLYVVIVVAGNGINSKALVDTGACNET